MSAQINYDPNENVSAPRGNTDYEWLYEALAALRLGTAADYAWPTVLPYGQIFPRKQEQ